MTIYEKLIQELQKAGITFFTGVPDSFLNGFCRYLSTQIDNNNHIIAANEGNAVAIAAGHYFASGKIPLVYMQNSGLGNAINPLVSLVDTNVYSVPMLLLIGWRGEPGIHDWAQHKRQGEITLSLLENMGISYAILSEDSDVEQTVARAYVEANSRRVPYALIARKGVLTEKKTSRDGTSYQMSREEAIEIIINTLPEDTFYVATTGRATRELYYLREKYHQGHDRDCLNVGSMGHASSLALGMALAEPGKRIVCLDGDAAAIMHMGAMAMAGKIPENHLIHIVLNNGAHESVGGEPSTGFQIDFTGIAQHCGYRTGDAPVSEPDELKKIMETLCDGQGAAFVEVRIHQGIRPELPALNIDHARLIQDFMQKMKV